MSTSFSQWAAADTSVVLEKLKTNLEGLSKKEIDSRLEEHGLNELVEHKSTWWLILKRQFVSPFTFILAVVMVFSFALGENIDGAMVSLFLVLNVSLGFFQEFRSEKSLQLLKKFISAKTHVVRDGKEVLIESKYLVPGDLVIIEAGDIVPADLRLVEVTNCTIDESSLTGESISVEKEATVHATDQIFEAHNIAFSATHVLSGRAKGVVFATGSESEIGSIAKMTDETKRVSGFEQSIAQYSQVILRIIFFTLLIVIGLNIALKMQSVNIFSLIFFGVALAISVIPEELPVVTTLALSQGALVLAKLKVVVKRLSAIEDLGSIQVLCTDKTGTLTQNVMKVSETYRFGVTEGELIFDAALGASFLGLEKKEPNNSFDLAIWTKLTQEEKKQASGSKFVLVMPFDPNRRRSSAIVQHGKQTTVISRGVPELLIEASSLTYEEKKKALEWASQQGHQGMRVLVVVSQPATSGQHSIKGEEDICGARCEGLIAFEDPLKDSAIPALKKAKKMGVQVKIVTGDSVEVSTHVAQKVGLIKSSDEVMTGEELDKLSARDQHFAVQTHQVFARVTPEQKHAIIILLEENDSVGFLGEGINDAPALKSAHVGIVVQGASDIATQAADVVLLDNDLAVIVEGIHKGREVFTNTVKYIKVTLSSNFGNFFAIAVASLLTPTLPMLPLQILLLNLLSDFPMVTIATDRVDEDEIRNPKTYQVHEVVILAFILGVVSTFFDFTFFAIFSQKDPAYLQTHWFMGSVLTELVFIYSIRVQKFFLKAVPPSLVMVGLTGFAALASIILPFTAIGQTVFMFVRPSFGSLGVVLLIVAAYFVVSEIVKLSYYSLTKQLVFHPKTPKFSSKNNNLLH